MNDYEISKISDKDIQDKVIEILQKLMDKWSFDNLLVEFGSSTRICYHQIDRSTLKSKLVFGVPCLRICMAYGSKHHNGYRGWDAVVSMTVHEFSHAIQCEMGLRLPKEVHTQDFFDIYNEAIKDFAL